MKRYGYLEDVLFVGLPQVVHPSYTDNTRIVFYANATVHHNTITNTQNLNYAMQNGKKQTGNNCLDVYALLTIKKIKLTSRLQNGNEEIRSYPKNVYIHGISATRKFLSDILHTCGDLRLY